MTEQVTVLKIEVMIREEERTALIEHVGNIATRNRVESIADHGGTDETPELEEFNESEVDSNGVPWNAEFHATTKGTNNDGTWKKKRGVDKDAVLAYESQFTSVETPPATTAPVVVPTVESPPVVVPTVETPPVTTAPVVMPTLPTAPVEITDVPYTGEGSVVEKFQQLVSQFGQEYVESKMAAIYKEAGVSSDGGSLQSEPAQRVSVYQQLSALDGS